MILNRNLLFSVVSAAFVTLIIGVFANCESSSTEAKENERKKTEALEFARQDRVQAQRDSVADSRQFKSESEAQIIKNSQLISDFKVRIMTGRVVMKSKYQSRLEKLEQKNIALKNKLEQYPETEADEREIFEHEWKRDMDQLVRSLQEIIQENG